MATQPAIHVTRDQFHLAWDPAIEPIETVGSGDVVEFDLPRRLRRPAHGDLDGRRPRRGSTSAGSTRSTGRSRSRARSPATRSRSTCSSSSPPTGAGRRASPASASWPTTSRTPTCGSPALPATGEPGRVPARRPRPVVPFCGEVGVAPAGRPALDDPAGRLRRQHGHAPPDGRRDALPAGLPRRRPALDRRRPRRPGRRRGLRDRDRDADAGDRPADRPQGPARDRAGVPDAPDVPPDARSAAATRRTASARTCWARPATRSAG